MKGMQVKWISNYPISLNLTGKSVVMIGGGKIAERKIKALLGTGAHIKVVSPELTTTFKKHGSCKSHYMD